jgi:3-oxoacyl-[acyl-carrier protein] reductase/meso-butanediol dehydrogenase/(S,S)-butanediol dehydrogenase/diacetyl reductase
VLDGKVAIVTGAGRLRGIGRATAVALAAQGADVVVTGTGRDPATFPADEKAINWNDVHSPVEQIEAQGRRGLALIGDISQQADVTRIVQQTLATFGRLDTLVNEEVAGLIAYLCSPIAEYITGQSINIDGGVVMW